MNTCKSCKHFEVATGHWRATPPYGSCGRWNTGYAFDDAKMPLNEVLVEDDEGWAAVVGPEFGCILHEATP